MAPKHDKPHLWLVRQPQGLVPYTDYDRDVIERYPLSTDEHRNVINCYLHQPTDDGLTRRFHAMVSLLAKGIGEDGEALKRRLMVQAGSVGSVVHVEGLGTTIYPKRWSELEHPEALDTYNRVAEIILTQFLPGMPKDELARKIQAYAGVQP